MSPEPRTLVVGTTGDYIDWIGRHYPARALFLTDPHARAKASEPAPDAAGELLADLTDEPAVWARLHKHPEQHLQTLAGVACFDDESMHLAALLAQKLLLPYPPPETILTCRNKHLCKEAWRQAGVPTARAILAESDAQAADFAALVNGSVVLKPATGSGSELAFQCHSPAQASAAYREIRAGLAGRAGNRMYFSQDGPGDTEPAIIVEEFVTGQEFSCDFIVEAGRARVIRFAAKLLAPGAPLGTARGYIIPATPPGLDLEAFNSVLARAAHAVGIDRSICMLDFFVDAGQPALLELAPRPGGDCLAWLIRHSSGLDMLGLTVDFAQRRPVNIPPAADWKPMVGLRIRADRAGAVRSIDTAQLEADPRVRQIHLFRSPGHEVILPPDDYDSWIFGHVIFQPLEAPSIESQCDDLANKLRIEIKP
ncbi:MAG: ATP-grasp domain-containing protein [Planctomycetota bacterium]|nr:ATP-grasp domain-containing protein [Planctomycetota bacterium]